MMQLMRNKQRRTTAGQQQEAITVSRAAGMKVCSVIHLVGTRATMEMSLSELGPQGEGLPGGNWNDGEAVTDRDTIGSRRKRAKQARLLLLPSNLCPVSTNASLLGLL